MLLLKPSMVVIMNLSVILVGSMISVMAKGNMMGVCIYSVPVNFLFGCSFVQYVRVVSGSWRVVVFLR